MNEPREPAAPPPAEPTVTVRTVQPGTKAHQYGADFTAGPTAEVPQSVAEQMVRDFPHVYSIEPTPRAADARTTAREKE